LSERRVFLHIGLPKTGTTSLQTFLARNRALLREGGFEYPEVATNPAGNAHHNLTWKLLGSESYAPDRGTLEEFIRHASALPRSIPNLVVSSEGFSHYISLAAPSGNAFTAWLKELSASFGAITVVVGMRPFFEFAESMYLQVVRTGEVKIGWSEAARGHRRWLKRLFLHLTMLKESGLVRDIECVDLGAEPDMVAEFARLTGIGRIAGFDRATAAGRQNPRLGLVRAQLVYGVWHAVGFAQSRVADRSRRPLLKELMQVPLSSEGITRFHLFSRDEAAEFAADLEDEAHEWLRDRLPGCFATPSQDWNKHDLGAAGGEVAQALPGAIAAARTFLNEFAAPAPRKAVKERFKEAWPPGHFYSALPELETARAVALAGPRRDVPRSLPDIDTREAEQRRLLTEFAKYAPEFPYAGGPANPHVSLRYKADNGMFGVGDALVLFCFLRHFRPRRVIEIGSGFSSALMLDVNEAFLQGAMKLTFIEPNAERLMSLLREGDRASCAVHRCGVQKVNLQVFDPLQSGDLLFVDCSHVGKAGSDLLHILFAVLPRLPAGCHVHFHDVFWPFEYPLKWLEGGRAWNEAYYIRTLLGGRSDYEITFHNHFNASVNAEAMRQALPAYFKLGGSSIYLRKCSSPEKS
jgi:hypothetical protein